MDAPHRHRRRRPSVPAAQPVRARSTLPVRRALRPLLAALPLLALLAGAPAGRAADGVAAAGTADPPLALENPAPGLYLHYGAQAAPDANNRGDIANSGIVVGSRCAAVIDSGGSAAVGRALLAALRQHTALPVCWVISTHGHPDHVFGHAAFKGEPAEFVGHARLAEALRRRGPNYLAALQRELGAAAAGSELVLPTRTVERELQLDLGGRVLRLRAWPTAHTDQDLTVFDEASGTLFAGDLLFVGHLPVVDGSLRGWLTVMDELRALGAARVLPGHGRSADTRADFAAQQRYLQQLATGVRAALRARKTMAQAMDELAAPTDGWLLTPLFHRRNVSAAYAELEWED